MSPVIRASSGPIGTTRPTDREENGQTMAERRIAVFGAGYIGLVTGACLAELGHHVTVRDIDPERVRILLAGDVPIHEPGLGDMIARNKERLTFTQDLDQALTGAEIAYVCVDTPPSASGDADLTRVWAVIRSLATAHDLRAVAMKSTVPVGTGARARVLLDEIGLSHVGYVSNPEFTAEGRAIPDFMAPDRIVIGQDDAAAGALVAALHTGIDAPVATMDVKSAEMVKLASNALLATKISFANEIATLCENTGANVTEVLGAVGMDHRLGAHFLRPGIGWGGSCFPKDSEALRQMASNTGFHPQLLTAVINVNNIQKRRAIQHLKDELGDLAGRRRPPGHGVQARHRRHARGAVHRARRTVARRRRARTRLGPPGPPGRRGAVGLRGPLPEPAAGTRRSGRGRDRDGVARTRRDRLDRGVRRHAHTGPVRRP